MIAAATRLATQRTRPALIVAGVVFVLAAALGTPVVSILKSEPAEFQSHNAQNQQVQRTIEAATGQSASFGVAALVTSPGDVRNDPLAQREALRIVSLLSAQAGFQRALDYPASRLPLLVSRDGHRMLVLAAFATRERSAHAVDRVRAQLAASPGAWRPVIFGGNDIAFHEINTRTSSDLARAESFAFPILLVLSFLVFRGLVAALLPLLVGGFAIVLTFVLLRAIDQLTGLSIFAVNLVTGLGLGLGIDYSLMVVSRHREELAAGGDTRAALARTLQTAGRTVLYSSLTVAGAMASMLVFPMRFLYSMGIGGGLVALSAGAVALLVLPAVLVALGPRINALAPAGLQRNAQRVARPAEQGAWFRLAQAVMRRPGTVAVVTGAALLLIALPALRLRLIPADARVLPASTAPRQVSEAITREFALNGSQTIPIVIHASASGQTRAARLAADAQASAAGLAGLVGPARYLGREDWLFELLPRGAYASAADQHLIARLRGLDGHALLVGGSAAWFVDQKSAIAAHTPLALLILALVTGGFLFLMTGSLVLPLLAITMNVLTVAVGAGLLVAIFQDGHLSGLLGFTPIGGLEEANLVLLFVVAFALSTDYGVFLFARIKEAHEDGRPTRQAVAYGLERTGRLITAAALLFCVAIGAFATSHIFFVKELGVGAALAVAIDATVVRALLVPALMGRLGERTWWAPAPLRRLHARIGLREGAPGAVSGAANA